MGKLTLKAKKNKIFRALYICLMLNFNFLTLHRIKLGYPGNFLALSLSASLICVLYLLAVSPSSICVRYLLAVSASSIWALIFTEKTRKDPRKPEKTRKDPERPEKTHLFIPRRPEKTHLFIRRRPEKTRKNPKRPEKTPGKTPKDPKRHLDC